MYYTKFDVNATEIQNVDPNECSIIENSVTSILRELKQLFIL